jgi:hypothetical protein
VRGLGTACALSEGSGVTRMLSKAGFILLALTMGDAGDAER